MTVGHAEDVISPVDQFLGEHLAALPRDIDAKFPGSLNRMTAGRLAFHGAESGRDHAVITTTRRYVAEDSFSHRTATNVAGANEQDRLHACVI